MKRKKTLLIATFWTGMLGLGSALMVLAGFYLYLSPGLPSVASIRDYRLQTPLRIYSADHKLIEEFGEKRRKPIKYEDIPEDFIHALIAAEDDDFYSHKGVSIRGLLRAVSHLVLTGRKGPGGSTLTMQLTRHVFLSLKQTFSRKFNEILLALRIEKELSKEEILELYVNLMFLGKRAWGIEAAAEVYYGKSIGELTLAQHAMIVGIFQGPSVQNPLANPERAIERRNYVLRRMRKLDYIDDHRYAAAVAEPVSAKYHGSKIELKAPYIAEMARQHAVEQFGVNAYTEGYRVYTTVRSDLQERAQAAVVRGLLTYDQRHGYRGPEQQLNLANAPPMPTSSPAATDRGPTDPLPPPSDPRTERNYTEWQQRLSSLPSYGGLHAAAVMRVNDDSLDVLLAKGDWVTLVWEHGLSQARRYITEDHLGPTPKQAADIAAVGDIIRLYRHHQGYWQLAQIPAVQGSLVALSPNNGAILALSGGFDFTHSHFNRATQAQRQPGSNFKPFVYTAAIEHGLSAATIINDAPIVFNDTQLESTWRPENSSGKFDGPTRLREALYRSKNLVSVRVLQRVGIRHVIDSLEKFGFNAAELPKDLSLALGSHAVTPMDIAKGYAIFANGGYRVEPCLVDYITKDNTETVFSAQPATVCKHCPDTHTHVVADSTATVGDVDDYKIEGDIFALSQDTATRLHLSDPQPYPVAPKVISDQVVYIVDSMMKDVVKRGTGFKAWQKFKRPDIGGKTGTTNGPVDAWFSGYHPNIVVSTWVGFDQNLKLGRREYGGSAALPMWMDFMELALAQEPITIRPQPPGIVSVKIDPETGKRARVGDPDAIFEYFREAFVPEMIESNTADPWAEEAPLDQELF